MCVSVCKCVCGCTWCMCLRAGLAGSGRKSSLPTSGSLLPLALSTWEGPAPQPSPPQTWLLSSTPTFAEVDQVSWRGRGRARTDGRWTNLLSVSKPACSQPKPTRLCALQTSACGSALVVA